MLSNRTSNMIQIIGLIIIFEHAYIRDITEYKGELNISLILPMCYIFYGFVLTNPDCKGWGTHHDMFSRVKRLPS